MNNNAFKIFDLQKDVEISAVRIVASNSTDIVLQFVEKHKHELGSEIYFMPLGFNPKAVPFLNEKKWYLAKEFEQKTSKLFIYDYKEIGENLQKENPTSNTNSINVNISGNNNSVSGLNNVQNTSYEKQAEEKITDIQKKKEKKTLLEKIRSFFNNSYVSGFSVSTIFEALKNIGIGRF